MSYKINKKAYADMYGPTVGDKIRLADTNNYRNRKRLCHLWRREKVWRVKLLEMVWVNLNFRMIREIDTVITNAIIIDYWESSKQI